MNKKIDELKRDKFIKFIKSLILYSDQYKRDNDCKSYVMALDSAWGTGKTYFLDLLCQDVTQKDKLKIVRYNAWKNDYCENAFEPLIYDILMSDCLSFPMQNIFDAKNLQKMISEIAKIGLAMGKQFVFDAAKNKFGIDVEKAFNEVKDSANPLKDFLLRQSRELNEINQEREAFEKFKKSLGEATSYLKDNNQKLVVIIDELDRCKPTFAIQTLEVVKHLFDIDNIVFLFAVDIQQLSHSISSVYGQGFDSVGYLCRFFDYIAKLPEPNINGFIRRNLSSIGIFCNPDSEGVKLVAHFFQEIYMNFEFSLRDLDTLIKSYKIVLYNFLKGYQNVNAHCLYIFFLALKYKFPRFFSKIFVYKKLDVSYFNDEIFDNIKEVFYKEYPFIKDAFEFIRNDIKLFQCKFRCKGVKHKSFVIISVDQNLEMSVSYIGEEDIGTIFFNDFDENLLFEPDLQNWENIKYMTYREYIYKQLEMYNFFNPETVEK